MGEISIIHADDNIFLTESSNDLKLHLVKVKEENAKAGLQLNIQNTKIMTTKSPVAETETFEGRHRLGNFFHTPLYKVCYRTYTVQKTQHNRLRMAE